MGHTSLQGPKFLGSAQNLLTIPAPTPSPGRLPGFEVQTQTLPSFSRFRQPSQEKRRPHYSHQQLSVRLC